MIINKDIHPEKDIYYIGALIIDILDNSSISKIEFFSILEILNSKTKVSSNIFLLALDWLFILGIIDINNKGITKCF